MLKPLDDIETPLDIDHLVKSFYTSAMKDDLIGKFFTEVIALNLEEHLPIIIGFWRSLLLNTHEYKGNPMIKHLALNDQEPIRKIHFERWLLIWDQTVDQLFEGPLANTAKSKAHQIAELMQYKISKQQSNDHKGLRLI